MRTTPVFIAAGLDIRKWPPTEFPSADVTAWAQDEDLYERAQSELGLHENPLQLLHADTKYDIDRLIDLIGATHQSTLVSLEITELALSAYPETVRKIITPNNLQWETLGFDVCDINGFFSFLNMSVYKEKALPLFKEDELLNAYALSEFANVRIPEHRPFIVVRLRRLVT